MQKKNEFTFIFVVQMRGIAWATAILQTLTGSASLLRSSLTPLLSTFVAVKPPSCHSKRLLSPVMPSRFRLYLWNSS